MKTDTHADADQAERIVAAMSDDDKLLNFFAGADALAALKAAGAPRDYSSTQAPLLTLIEQISQRKNSSQVYIKRNGVTVRFSRRPATT